MTQYYEVTTPLGGGEYMFRGFTSDPNYQYPGCKTFLDPISEERMRDTQKYNPGYETLLTMTTPNPLQGYRIQLRELRAEMKRRGIRRISPFNGGLTSDELRMNTERFRLETEISKLSK